MRHALTLFLLIGLLLGLSGPAQAQSGFQYGFTFGMNRVTLQSPEELRGHFLFAGGVVLRQPLYGPVFLQSEVLLNQKGGVATAEEGGGIEYNAGYIEIPLLLHVKGPSLTSVDLYAEIGGFGGVKIFERQAPAGDINVPFDTGVSFYQRVDAGIVAGIGATLPLGERGLNVTVRRAWGLPDVARAVENQPFDNAPFPDTGRTRAWSMLLRFGF